MIKIQIYAKFYYLCQNMKNLGKLCQVGPLSAHTSIEEEDN